MFLPPRPESWNAGAGPDDDAANAADAHTAASAIPLQDSFHCACRHHDSLRQKKTVALSRVSMLLVTLVSPNKSESNTRSCTPI